MIKVAVDTNILVSAFLVAESNPARLLDMVLSGSILLCYDSRIMLEYKTVLFRLKFPFRKRDVQILLDTLMRIGLSVLAEPSEVQFSDVADKKFFEAALSAGAYLITGNGKHYPEHRCVFSPAEFLERLMS